MKISEFQNLIKDIYIIRDKERGVKSTFIWLIEEIGELAQILKSSVIDKESVSEELADVIAWTSSLANLLNIDLELALSTKYPNMCIKCKSNPCICKD
ncbi:MAG: MazG nucleotide pyrophosphohydrolase domain-containing protein [Promethearchaeota archaeon]